MKTYLTLSILICLFLSNQAKGQFVTIPDAGFVSYLTTNFPSAMNGNQMDTTNTAIINHQTLNVSGLAISNFDGLQYFDTIYSCDISNCGAQTLPALPPNLTYFNCSNNNLTALPTLPVNLNDLYCVNNQLTLLPALPNNLDVLACDSNQITSLPTLPPFITTLSCTHNQLTCLPLLPNFMVFLFIVGNNINCIPNVTMQQIGMDTTITNFCGAGNIWGCPSSQSISGALFNDVNNNCVNTTSLFVYSGVKLYDNSNNFIQYQSIAQDTNYHFNVLPDDYIVAFDSSLMTNSVSLPCPINGQYAVSVQQNVNYFDKDFGVKCNGVDVGINNVFPSGIVFPGQSHSIHANMGDLSNNFSLNCATGTGGTVQITVTGPVTYTGVPAGSLTPSINGNTYTYTIADFGTISTQTAFILNFLTDTTAQLTDQIFVSASITSTATDIDLSNNSMSISYSITNSYDPNMKVTNPMHVLPGYNDYFTYTIHFQNLGNAPAFNIKIRDTLDPNLDYSTFRVIQTSHPHTVNLTDEKLTVFFNDILLPDSASNPEGSKGYITYQVKPKSNLPDGTSIENTAHIFFDYNPAIVTNTTENLYQADLSVQEFTYNEFSIFPNPSSGIIQINTQVDRDYMLSIYNLQGKLVYQADNQNGNSQLNLNQLKNGFYTLSIADENNKSANYKIQIIH